MFHTSSFICPALNSYIFSLTCLVQLKNLQKIFCYSLHLFIEVFSYQFCGRYCKKYYYHADHEGYQKDQSERSAKPFLCSFTNEKTMKRQSTQAGWKSNVSPNTKHLVLITPMMYVSPLRREDHKDESKNRFNGEKKDGKGLGKFLKIKHFWNPQEGYIEYIFKSGK